MLLLNKNCIGDLKTSDIEAYHYHPVPAAERWRLGFLDEMMEMRQGVLEVPDMEEAKVEAILQLVYIFKFSWLFK